MQCSKCNTVLKADAKFCKVCGSKVDDRLQIKAEAIQKQADASVYDLKQEKSVATASVSEQKKPTVATPVSEQEKSAATTHALRQKKSTNKVAVTIAIVAVIAVGGAIAGYFALGHMFGSDTDMMLNANAPDNAENLNNTLDSNDAEDMNEPDFESPSNADVQEELDAKESPDENMYDENSQNSYETGMDEYILPDSDKRMLSAEEVSVLSKDDLALARNEIYARHGYIFNTEKYRAYFSSKSWYAPDSTYVAGDATLNQFEIKNIQLIKSYEQ